MQLVGRMLRGLPGRRQFEMPFVAWCFVGCVEAQLIYIWADAIFYRPITMRRVNLPLSFQMTARRFLETHGLLD
ncbi:DUF3413 domain-containing protein, partial [Salmonella enterica]|uniref:DUF3413 domain-containing protein n=1 Tax=Salmonella enterica TaxID=28901 RepID=UPI00398C36B8